MLIARLIIDKCMSNENENQCLHCMWSSGVVTALYHGRQGCYININIPGESKKVYKFHEP